MTNTELLTNWVQQKHQGQIKKYSGDPYFHHVAAVAAMAKDATMFGYEIGLCHDLLEDTPTTQNDLFETLLGFGYADMEANYITIRVVELTDVFTSAAYPAMNRTQRKAAENLRLATISAGAQTVKYADIIYNTNLVLHHDRPHAAEYLQNKQALLNTLTHGDKALHQQAIELVSEGLRSLSS
jgi:(p)ppGpp synthase/HD superfamily hydrolase